MEIITTEAIPIPENDFVEQSIEISSGNIFTQSESEDAGTYSEQEIHEPVVDAIEQQDSTPKVDESTVIETVNEESTNRETIDNEVDPETTDESTKAKDTKSSRKKKKNSDMREYDSNAPIRRQPYEYVSESFETMNEFREMVDTIIEKFNIETIVKIVKVLETGWTPDKLEVMKTARDLAFAAISDSKNRSDGYGMAEKAGIKVTIHTKENAEGATSISDKISVSFDYIAVSSSN